MAGTDADAAGAVEDRALERLCERQLGRVPVVAVVSISEQSRGLLIGAFNRERSVGELVAIESAGATDGAGWVKRQDQPDGLAFSATGNLVNRRELRSAFEAGPGDMVDAALMRHAYRTAGVSCVRRFRGHWAFAAWHPRERTMVLARDAFGTTAIYYYLDDSVFAFGTSPDALLNLKLTTRAVNELYLGQFLVSWPEYHGRDSIYRGIHRLAPAHYIVVTPSAWGLHEYWHPDEVVEQACVDRREYVTRFHEVFDAAVGDCLKISRTPGVMLSGGLDSGTVASVAAEHMRRQGRRLPAFTSIPAVRNTTPVGPHRTGDESMLAQATARAVGSVDWFPVHEGLSPIQAVRRMLRITGEPVHGASNAFWVLAILSLASSMGCQTLLTGQFGNATISWARTLSSRPARHRLARLGWRGLAKLELRRRMPARWLSAWRRHSLSNADWHRHSAIHPQFARKLRLLERRLDDPLEHAKCTARQLRSHMLMPGRHAAGAQYAAIAERTGVRLVDPTANERVLTFTYSIPDRVFFDSNTGMERWLIREATKTRLPAVVRLNRRLGYQAADLLARLRASAEEVDMALDELGRGPAAEYVDVSYMRDTWQIAQAEDTPQSLHRAGTILMRGIMAGLFVNEVAA